MTILRDRAGSTEAKKKYFFIMLLLMNIENSRADDNSMLVKNF